MNPFKKFTNFLFIDEEENEVIEETEAELEPIENETNDYVTKSIKIDDTSEKPIEKLKEFDVIKNSKLSDIVPSADEIEVKKTIKNKHLSIDEVKDKPRTNRIIEKKTYKYESSPIISPIFGMSDQGESKVVVATKPELDNLVVKTSVKVSTSNKSRLDTIISPIYGTNIKYEKPILVNQEETIDYFENNVVVDENQIETTKDVKAEDLSLDDILETPTKRVLSKVELNQNMTIFDEELKDK